MRSLPAWSRRHAAVLVAACGLTTACEWAPRRGEPEEEKPRTVTVESRHALLATFPCSRCHANRTPNPERRALTEFHTVRTVDFSHGDNAFWCYQCHSIKNLDELVTATGVTVSIDEAWKLCTSCHGEKLEDWKAGTHGLLVGDWNGPRVKLSCPACHNPHHPRYPTIEPEPMPAPVKQLSPFGTP